MGEQLNKTNILNRFNLSQKRKKLRPIRNTYVKKKHTVVIIKQTLNNIFVGINDAQFTVSFSRTNKMNLIKYKFYSGKLKFTSTCGMVGFKGPRRPTHYAAEVLGRVTAKKLKELKIKQIVILYKSPVTNKISSFLTGLFSRFNYNVPFILDRLSLGHNGIRKQKARRM